MTTTACTALTMHTPTSLMSTATVTTMDRIDMMTWRMMSIYMPTPLIRTRTALTNTVDDGATTTVLTTTASTMAIMTRGTVMTRTTTPVVEGGLASRRFPLKDLLIGPVVTDPPVHGIPELVHLRQ